MTPEPVRFQAASLNDFIRVDELLRNIESTYPMGSFPVNFHPILLSQLISNHGFETQLFRQLENTHLFQNAFGGAHPATFCQSHTSNLSLLQNLNNNPQRIRMS